MQCAMDASVLSHACTGMWCLRECAPESNTGLIPDMGEIRPPLLGFSAGCTHRRCSMVKPLATLLVGVVHSVSPLVDRW